jgi:hypothetical protein
VLKIHKIWIHDTDVDGEKYVSQWREVGVEKSHSGRKRDNVLGFFFVSDLWKWNGFITCSGLTTLAKCVLMD